MHSKTSARLASSEKKKSKTDDENLGQAGLQRRPRRLGVGPLLHRLGQDNLFLFFCFVLIHFFFLCACFAFSQRRPPLLHRLGQDNLLFEVVGFIIFSVA